MSHKPLKIEVLAPSSHIGTDALIPSIERLESSGHHVILNPQLDLRLHQSAGTAQEKAEALTQAICNPESDVILCAVGGNRALGLLEHLDFKAIQNVAKPVIGFSDATSLINALTHKTSLRGIHGPTLNRIAKLNDACYDSVLNSMTSHPSPVPLDEALWLKDGEASGPIYGGNLSVFQSLIGTPYLPALNGAILFFEDIGDELSRYDRMLAHIRAAGLFDQCSGVIFGDMSEARDTGRKAFGFSTDDVIMEHCRDVDGPVITQAPFGHRGDFYSIPLKCSCFVSLETLAFEGF